MAYAVEPAMARILGIGIATLDIINTVECYPPEDAEVRALDQRLCRGGNVTNTLVVLSQLGHACAWGGVQADDPDAERIRADLAASHIDTSLCRTVADGRAPVSYVTLSRRSGSRTIVHYRDLPEFGFDDFRHVDLHGYDWLHFEGRNVAETRRMIDRARAFDVRISVEIEKPRDGIEALFDGVDVLLFARAYARSCGYERARDLLEQARTHTRTADLVCAWGEQGAWALSRDGRWLHSPAAPPPKLIDSLGAGDTFNAGVIDGCLRGLSWDEILEGASRLAGKKCGQIGFGGLIQ